MKRILFLAADLCSGGAERQLVTLAIHLKRKGYDVLVYCYERSGFYSSLLNEANVPIVWEIESNNYLRRIWRVRKHIRKGKYDAVISFLPSCNFLNDIAALGKHSWKVITGERSAKLSTFTSRKGKIFAWMQFASDYIVCNSNNAASLWSEYYPDYKDKLRVIYNSVCLGPVKSAYQPRIQNITHFIVAATFQYIKNPLGLVNALTLMSESERDKIVIDWYGRKEMSRGSTQAYDDTVAAIIKNGLENVLILHPETNELADIMFQSDIVMLLSTVEGLPNVICEGMTLGKPIVMTKVSDYGTLVDESNGFLCDGDSPESIKEAILHAASSTTQNLLKMGQSSKEKANALFSDNQIVSQWQLCIDDEE